MSLPDPDEMFRRHQAEHDAEVAKAERERIIKVLNTAKGTDCGCNDCKGVHNYIDLLVDLIQGKNK